MKTTLVGLLSASAQTFSSVPFTSSTSTPQAGKNSVRTTWHELNIAAVATTRSPALTMQATDANMAAIPEPVATQSSAPSSSAKRFSNMATVGLPKRL